MQSGVEIRAARPGDEEALLALARHLDTVNLAHDRDHVRALLETSERSFSGRLPERERRYVFVLVDHDSSALVGTSMIVAQLGRREAPYIYLDVLPEERYSPLLDRHFHHTLLRLGMSYDGPTEIGGLVVTPERRRGPEKPGLLISYVRFLFIAAHRASFRDELLAELLPPLLPDGRSHLWEALGRHFTGLSYQEADRLSSSNKDFIRDLFPTGVLYASVLSPEAQAVIGKVGAQTRGVEKLLRRIGFRYAERVDPFDGGPHFTAPTDEVTLVAATRRFAATVAGPGVLAGATRWLVGRDFPAPPWFRALPCRALPEGAELHVSAEDASRLGVARGEEVVALPLEG